MANHKPWQYIVIGFVIVHLLFYIGFTVQHNIYVRCLKEYSIFDLAKKEDDTCEKEYPISAWVGRALTENMFLNLFHDI